MNGTWRQEAHGDVLLPVVSGTNHCGIDEEAVCLHYDVYLEFRQTALDTQGFLLDNLSFKGYFTGLSTNPVDISCENLAEKIAQDFVSMLDGRSHDLISIKVCLSPFQGVLISYESSGPFRTIPVHFPITQPVESNHSWIPRPDTKPYGYA